MTPLTRSQVLDRLREHGAAHGFVTMDLIRGDGPLFRSLLVHFDSMAVARAAAGLPGSRRKSEWSLERVLDELRRLDESGASTSYRDLAGRSALVAAIAEYAGGLRRARKLAGIATPKVVRNASADKPAARARPAEHAGQNRKRHAPYTAADVIRILQEIHRTRPDITVAELYKNSAVGAMRRLFGSVENAVAAASIQDWPVRQHKSWDRAGVLRELRANARRGIETVTRKLFHACVMYFGSVRAARTAAGLPMLVREPWTKETLLDEFRRRARGGDYGADLEPMARRLFGSIDNARRVAGVAGPVRIVPPRRVIMAKWSNVKVLEELRKCAAEARITMGLRDVCQARFGSMDAAKRAAGVPVRADLPKAEWVQQRANTDARYEWRRWSRDVIKRKLRAWNAQRGPMPRDLLLACKHRFGSLKHACAAAKVEPLRTSTRPAPVKGGDHREAHLTNER